MINTKKIVKYLMLSKKVRMRFWVKLKLHFKIRVAILRMRWSRFRNEKSFFKIDGGINYGYISVAFVAVLFVCIIPFYAYAGENIEPSHFLYPVKRNIEKVIVAVVRDPESSLKLEIKFLERRLHESKKLYVDGLIKDSVVIMQDGIDLLNKLDLELGQLKAPDNLLVERVRELKLRMLELVGEDFKDYELDLKILNEMNENESRKIKSNKGGIAFIAGKLKESPIAESKEKNIYKLNERQGLNKVGKPTEEEGLYLEMEETMDEVVEEQTNALDDDLSLLAKNLVLEGEHVSTTAKSQASIGGKQKGDTSGRSLDNSVKNYDLENLNATSSSRVATSTIQGNGKSFQVGTSSDTLLVQIEVGGESGGGFVVVESASKDKDGSTKNTDVESKRSEGNSCGKGSTSTAKSSITNSSSNVSSSSNNSNANSGSRSDSGGGGNNSSRK